ncbi:MAG: hypothetical protein A2Y12_04335 [Planctomycetes bacterium GWF2_42_9]|nr:MAG: hypothetical protein A2Y12_04335 [Planctomycetes bacterium GWF2_42_9]
MKTSSPGVLLFTVVLSLIVMPNGVAQAVPLMSQTFDDTNIFVAGTRLGNTGIGNSPVSVGLWKASGQTAFGGALVNNVESWSSGQSLEVGRTGDNFETGQFIGIVDNGVTAGEAVVSFRAKRGAAGWSDPGVEYQGAGSTFIVGDSAMIDTVFPAESIALKLHSDNNLYVCNNGAYVKILSGIDAIGWDTPGTWHAYKMVIDMDNHAYDVYYSADGTDASFIKLYDNATYSPASAGIELNAVRTSAPYFTTWRGPVWFDDVVMTPEPATMMMFSLGGFALVRRRK